jgi:hypothetical protein
MANHEILTWQEDLELGQKVVHANSLWAAMAELIETKSSALEDEILYQVYSDYYSEKIWAEQAKWISMMTTWNICLWFTLTTTMKKNFSIRKAWQRWAETNIRSTTTIKIATKEEWGESMI